MDQCRSGSETVAVTTPARLAAFKTQSAQVSAQKKFTRSPTGPRKFMTPGLPVKQGLQRSKFNEDEAAPVPDTKEGNLSIQVSVQDLKEVQ